MIVYNQDKKVFIIKTNPKYHKSKFVACYSSKLILSNRRQSAYEFDNQKDALEFARYLTEKRNMPSMIKESFEVVRDTDNPRLPKKRKSNQKISLL
jgi:hypothetical protein